MVGMGVWKDMAAQIDARLGEGPDGGATPADLAAENARLLAEVARLDRRLQELQRDADADPLMDIYNRRAFVRELARAQTVSERYHIPSVVLYFDLDDFKTVNDRYGHAVGDELLRQIGGVLCASVRDCDLVARLGGDEFGVLLFKTTPDEARAKAQSLVCRIQSCRIDFPTGAASVGASWGAAPCEPGTSAEAVIARADRAMYFDKAG